MFTTKLISAELDSNQVNARIVKMCTPLGRSQESSIDRRFFKLRWSNRRAHYHLPFVFTWRKTRLLRTAQPGARAEIGKSSGWQAKRTPGAHTT